VAWAGASATGRPRVVTVVPGLAADPNALRVRKRLIPVRVAFAPEDGICDTREGPVRYRAGDPILTGTRGERWPVRGDLFAAGYDPVPPTVAGEDGMYCKRLTDALATRLDRPVSVPGGPQHDPLFGRSGDWLLCYPDGTLGIVEDGIFRATYGPAPGENRWPPPQHVGGSERVDGSG
jgi:PGDYG protein